jgi:carbon monoxide dehydrogenase subunit G
MMRELESHIFTEIKIDATVDQVWAVLTDLKNCLNGVRRFKV